MPPQFTGHSFVWDTALPLFFCQIRVELLRVVRIRYKTSKIKKTMYAIIKNGGRQVKAEVDRRLRVDYQDGLRPGDSIEFTEVLSISNENDVKIGKPTVAGAKVVAEVVVPEFKGPKLIIAKLRRRKNSKRKTGHRQVYTLVQVKEIVG